MMITAEELEEIIARTPAGEQVVYDGREIGSTGAIAEKLTQLKIKSQRRSALRYFHWDRQVRRMPADSIPDHGRSTRISGAAQDRCLSGHRQKHGEN
jgi:hypothetical protein